MELENVHVMEKDRATNQAKLVHINPTRSFCAGVAVDGLTAGGNKVGYSHSWYTWQNGEWFGLGGNHIDEKDVPQALLDNIANVPFKDVALAGQPSITKVCKFCSDKMNASQYDDHMEQHVMTLLNSSAAKPAPAKPAATPAAH